MRLIKPNSTTSNYTPMLITSMWTHGNVMVVEDPQTIHEIQYKSDGAHMKVNPGARPHFHVPIPTPKMVNNQMCIPQKLTLLYQTKLGEVKNIKVYNGRDLVQEFPGLALNDNYTNILVQNKNVFDFPVPPQDVSKIKTKHIQCGISVKITFQASTITDNPGGVIPADSLFLLTAAGIDFVG